MRHGERRELYKQCAAKWGSASQIMQAAEEAAELSVALHHFSRGAPIEEVVDEIADVEIMIEQLKQTHGIDSLYLSQLKEQKLERVKKLLEED